MKRLLLLIVLLSFGTSLFAQSDEMDGTHWWNDRVFYEIFVRSFNDSDGDGIGDLQGIIDKLDYLNDGDPSTTDDLGITGIWLMPIFEAQSYHGYDVLDYYAIEQDYGTLEDFKALVDAAHDRGIAVIIDMVINHTSSKHTWFVESADPNSEFADWYIWRDENPGFAGATGQTIWHTQDDRYYLGIFWSEMPDLNLENDEVTQEIYDVTRFWLEETGVDGFRLDAAKHFIEEGNALEHTDSTFVWLQDYREFVRSVNPDALLVGEIWTDSDKVAPYVRENAVDLAFEFDLASALISSARFGLSSFVNDQLLLVDELYPPQQYATFLANHDQVRVMDSLNGDVGDARNAASLLLTLPGVPFMYYGEEIGMLGKKPDERIRTPMQWDATEGTAGFTIGQPYEALQDDYAEVNVSAQIDDPDSLLSHYRTLIAARNASPALRRGDFVPVEVNGRGVNAFLRIADEETVLVVMNLSDNLVNEYTLSLPEGTLSEIVDTPTLILGNAEVTAPQINAEGGFDEYQPVAQLPAFSTFVIKLR